MCLPVGPPGSSGRFFVGSWRGSFSDGVSSKVAWFARISKLMSRTDHDNENRNVLLPRTMAARAVGARLRQHRRDGFTDRAHGRVRMVFDGTIPRQLSV